MIRNHLRSLALVSLILLPLVAASADDPVACGRAFWTAPTAASCPVPQAFLSPDPWPQASAFTGFAGLASGVLTRNQPVFWIARDDSRLLIAWRVPRLGKGPFAKAATERDGPVWNDDAIEVFLDPGHTHKDYFQFIVNAAGTLFDARGRDATWNADCDVKVAENANAWAGVLAIPFASLGAAAPGEGAIWGFNAGVDRSPAQRPQLAWGQEEQNTTWADLGQSQTLHDPAHFGHLVFRAATPVQFTSVGTPWWRTLALEGRSTVARIGSALAPATGGTIWRGDAQPGEAGFSLKSAELTAGDYSFRIEATTAQGMLAAFPARFCAAALLEPKLEMSALRQTLDLSASLETPDPPAASGLKAQLLDQKGETVRSGVISLAAGHGQNAVHWSFDGIPQGVYKLVMQDDTRADLRAELPWSPPEKPSWLGSEAGKYGDDYVPRAWTPLKVIGRDPLRIACWGREYTFSPAGLFGAVRSQAKELLSGPMSLDASAGGKTVTWKPSATRVTKTANGAVEFEAAESGEGLRLSCQGRMEFDGFVKLRIRVVGTGAARDLQGLSLSIPFRRDVAKLLHNYPKPSVWTGVDMKKFNARAVPAEGWVSPFVYHVWVGDEEKGLQWLCETDENWRPADPEKAIELLPEGDHTTLKLNLIGKPTRLDKPLEYVFAFEASPVKAMPKDYRQWHYAQVGSYGMEKWPWQPSGPARTVTYAATGNLRPERGTVEVTVSPKFDSMKPGELNRSLFTVKWPDDTRQEPERGAWFYWNQDDKGMRIVFREDSKYTVLYGAPFAWKAGETHTVAFTWGEDGGIFVDGKRLAQGPKAPMFTPASDLGRAQLMLGGKDSDFIIRQMRVSDVIRPAETMGVGAAAMEADAHTLLLDRFDGIAAEGERRFTRPTQIAGKARGELSDPVTTVEGGLDIGSPPVTGTELDRLKSLGLQYIGFHEQWSDWQGFPRTTHTEELRSLIKGCHEKGLKLILYHSWQLSDTAPEYPLYLHECEVVAPDRFLYTREPKQTDYPVCQRSVWGDFLADGLDKLFRDFGPDGIYSDGLSYPGECSNELHGCGYVGEDGKRHPTLSLFADREAMKRFSHILELQGKPTLFVCHTSGQIPLPTLGFADAYLDGEHLTGQKRPFRVPLDAFRAEFMGHNFGIPAYFLVYDWNQGMTTDEGLALAMLHDTEVPWSYDAMAPVWKAWQDFGVEKARFLPYWGKQDWLAGAPEASRSAPT